MSVSYLYFIILAILIPFLVFILPTIFNLFNYTYWIPKEFIFSIIISLVVGSIIVGFHIQNTNEQCNKSNVGQAILTGLKSMLLVLLTINALNYYPKIIDPFCSVFYFCNDLAKGIYQSILIYAVVFINLTRVSFSSIKQTCKADINQIKNVYQQLQSELK